MISVPKEFPEELQNMLKGPWSEKLKTAIEMHYEAPLDQWPGNGTPGPWLVQMIEPKQWVVYKFQLAGLPDVLRPTGFTDRIIWLVNLSGNWSQHVFAKSVLTGAGTSIGRQ